MLVNKKKIKINFNFKIVKILNHYLDAINKLKRIVLLKTHEFIFFSNKKCNEE